MGKTTIEWTARRIKGVAYKGYTFNPWWGCTKVAPGCKHCYAERDSKRFEWDVFGPTKERRFMSESYWRKPLSWDDNAWRCGYRLRVFCASMADVFEHYVGPNREYVVEERLRLWDVIEKTEWLDWLILTKRPEHVLEMVPKKWRDILPPNIVIGTSAGTQKRLEQVVTELFDIRAHTYMLSLEPLLEPLNVWRVLMLAKEAGIQTSRVAVVVGGESGRRARPMNPFWVQAILDSCQSTGTPFFFKQWGRWQPVGRTDGKLPTGTAVVDYSGEVLPQSAEGAAGGGACYMQSVGKHNAGRLFRGREWNEFPEPVLPEPSQVAGWPDTQMSFSFMRSGR